MPIAYCKNCKLRFVTNAVSFPAGVAFGMFGCTVSCPKCGEMVEISDGWYIRFDSVAEGLGDIGLTAKQAKRVKRVLLTARDLEAVPSSLDARSKGRRCCAQGGEKHGAGRRQAKVDFGSGCPIYSCVAASNAREFGNDILRQVIAGCA